MRVEFRSSAGPLEAIEGRILQDPYTLNTMEWSLVAPIWRLP